MTVLPNLCPNLPEDVLYTIFCYATPKDLDNYAGVSTLWSNIASIDSLWKKFIPDIIVSSNLSARKFVHDHAIFSYEKLKACSKRFFENPSLNEAKFFTCLFPFNPGYSCEADLKIIEQNSEIKEIKIKKKLVIFADFYQEKLITQSMNSHKYFTYGELVESKPKQIILINYNYNVEEEPDSCKNPHINRFFVSDLLDVLKSSQIKFIKQNKLEQHHNIEIWENGYLQFKSVNPTEYRRFQKNQQADPFETCHLY